MKDKRIHTIVSTILVAALLFPCVSRAQTDKTAETYNKITSNSEVKHGLEFIKSDEDNTFSQQIEMTEIPAVPNDEEKKAEYFKNALKELGLKDTYIDKTGNVIGTRPGKGDGPTLVLSAHLDIAFEKGVDTTVTKKDGKYYAPGISDDTRGLAAILSVGRALNEAGIQTSGDIMFVGTVGEEDDFRGVEALFKEHDNIDGFITVDGASTSQVQHGNTAGYTIKFTYHGPGGHSFGAFDTPSAIHALGRAVAEISDWGKKDPKTTFNVGIISGGTAENAKAEEASMLMEFRTDGPDAEKLKKKLMKAVEDSADKENKRWGKGSKEGVTVDSDVKVRIPGGTLPKDAMIVQAAATSTKAIGKQPEFSTSGMTDANYSYDADVPGISLGGGGTTGKAHSLDEWYDPTDSYFGPQKIFLTALGLVGVEDLTEPLLSSVDATGGKDGKKAEYNGAISGNNNTSSSDGQANIDDKSGQGGKLPVTAGNTPLLILIGSLMVITGGVLVFRRKKSIN